MNGRRLVRELGPPALVVALVAAAMAGVILERSVPGVLVVVLDLSGPSGESSRAAAVGALVARLERLPSRTKVAVPSPEATWLGPITPAEAVRRLRETAGKTVTNDGGDLGRTILDAAALVRAEGGGSILLATGGRGIDTNAVSAASEAARAGVVLHVLSLPDDDEVAMEGLWAPSSASPGAIVEATALVRSTVAQRARVELLENGTAIGASEADLMPGALHAVSLEYRSDSRPVELTAIVRAERDEDPGNNLARVEVGRDGTPRLAMIGASGSLGAAVDRLEALPAPEDLALFDAVLVVVDAAHPLAESEQERLAAHVRAGGGVVVACDDPDVASRLRGGPLEAVLPVRLEPPRRSGDDAAVVVLLDRSGSMDRSEALATASEAARTLESLLGPRDRLGLIAFDVTPHVLRPLAAVGTSARATPASAPIEARGGTDWGPALDLALDWLADEREARRHVVLVSDGVLAPGARGVPSRDWPEGVTLSTVSVGDDADPGRLRELSALRGGRHDHAASARDLPLVLRREAARLRLPETVQGPWSVLAGARALPRVSLARGQRALVVTARDDADVWLTLAGDAPLLAFGRAAWGRSAFLAVDPWALGGGAEVATIALVRAGAADGPAGPDLAVTVAGASASVEIRLERPATAPSPLVWVRYPSGPELALDAVWTGADRARASFTIEEAGTYRVESSGARRRFVVAAASARAALAREVDWAQRLAAAGGGEVLDPSSGPPRIGAGRRIDDVTVLLVALAAAVVFLDTLVGRDRQALGAQGRVA